MPIKDASYWRGALDLAQRIQSEARNYDSPNQFTQTATGFDPTELKRLIRQINQAQKNGGEAKASLISQVDRFTANTRVALFLLDTGRALKNQAKHFVLNLQPNASHIPSQATPDLVTSQATPEANHSIPIQAAAAPTPGRWSWLPNVITLGNMASGFSAIVAAGTGYGHWVPPLIGLGMAFDFADGGVARLPGIRRVRTPMQQTIGRYLDSLADMVTFGIAPSIAALAALTNAFGFQGFAFGLAGAMFYTLGAGYRLARFDASATLDAGRPQAANASNSYFFDGAPSPLAAAGVAMALAFFNGQLLNLGLPGYVLAPMAGLGLALLGRTMIGHLPYIHPGRSAGELRRRPRTAAAAVLGTGASIATLGPALTGLLIVGGFLGSGPIVASRQRRRARNEAVNGTNGHPTPSPEDSSPNLDGQNLNLWHNAWVSQPTNPPPLHTPLFGTFSLTHFIGDNTSHHVALSPTQPIWDLSFELRNSRVLEPLRVLKQAIESNGRSAAAPGKR